MKLYSLSFLMIIVTCFSQNTALKTKTDQLAKDIDAQVIEWRRHFHQNPELSNREFKTGEKIAELLEDIGLEVKTGIANTGVVGISA